MDGHDDPQASTRDRVGDDRKEDLGVPGAVTGPTTVEGRASTHPLS